MNSTKRIAVQTALMMLAGFCAPAAAFQPLITDDTGTQGSGGNQIEFLFNDDLYSPNRNLDFALGILNASDNDGPRTTTHTATAGITWRFR